MSKNGDIVSRIPTRAILYMMISASGFAILNAIVRELDHFPTFQLVFFRSVGTVFFCLLLLRKFKVSMIGNNQKILFIRALAGFISLSLFYKAIQMMPLGTAVSLRYLSPFFAAAFAILFLKEKVLKMQWLFFIIAFIGVVLLKGFDPRITVLGLLVILSSAVFSGGIYVIVRKIGRSEHPLVIVNFFLGLSSVLSGLICLFNWVPPLSNEWPLIMLMGVFGLVGQLYMTKALQIAEANLITPFKYSEVIFTILVGWLVFGESQSLMALLAILIIILALLGNVFIKARHSN